MQKSSELTVIVELFSTFAEKVFSNDPQKDLLSKYLLDFKTNIYNNTDNLENVQNFFQKNPIESKNKSSLSSSKSNSEKMSNNSFTHQIESNVNTEMARNCEEIEEKWISTNNKLSALLSEYKATQIEKPSNKFSKYSSIQENELNPSLTFNPKNYAF